MAVGPVNEVGEWTDLFSWPIIGLHVQLTPDGKILTFGTDQNGVQSGLHVYDVWDPVTNTHQTLQHTTHSDLFCSVSMIIPETGNVLFAGGDARPADNFNSGIIDVNVFDPTDVSLHASSTGTMQFARWYASAVTLASGEILIIGGRNDNKAPDIGYSAYAEIYTPGFGFRTLTGTYIDTFNITSLYPRTWLTSSGTVWTTSDGTGNVYAIDPTGVGSVALIGAMPTAISWDRPSIMYAPDKVLLIGNDGSAWTMDMSGPTPVYERTEDVGDGRIWSNLVLLPDGRVMISGGSAVYNETIGVNNEVEIWDPKTGHWTQDADAAVARLYHSDTILLNDGTILSLGGGAPGPLMNLNGEIYKPDYLFDQNGNAAVRPVITESPTEKILPGATFTVHVDDAAAIESLVIMPFGSVTHSFNMTAKRIELAFTVNPDGTLTAELPTNSNVVTPGYWQLFAIDTHGTPSVASTLQIGTEQLYHFLPQQNLDLLDENMVMVRNGDAAYDAWTDSYVLTPDAELKHGSFMSPQRVDLSKAFEITFEINVGDKDANGADGMAFVLHNDPLGSKAIGERGGGLGAMGIQNGLAIEFDTYQSIDDIDDIANDHTSFLNTADPSNSPSVSPVHDLGNIEDGQWHTVKVTSDGVNISYTFDGVLMETMTLAQAQTYLGGSHLAYFGFTGGTGGLTEQEQARILSLIATTESGSEVHLDRSELATTPQFASVGDATYDAATKIYTVTPDAELQHGAVMSEARVDLSQSFRLAFDINVGNKDGNGADGMGFVFHNDPLGAAAIGDRGGGLGMMGIQNGLGIEFDTYQSLDNLNDIANDHTSFINTADGSASPSVSPVVDLGNIEDGRWHRVEVFSDGQNISYTFDGVAMGAMTLAQAETYLGGSHLAYFGITGATGGLTELEQVRVVKLDATTETGEKWSVIGPNHDPVAVNDTYTVSANGVLTVSAANGVLANDSDPDGDTLTICSETRVVGHDILLAPENGTLTMNRDGSFTYIPNAGFVGVDTFHYCMEDGPACVEGTVTINVTGGVGGGVPPSFTANGNAFATGANAFTVTPNAEAQHGSIISDTRVDLSKAFDITFQINVGANDNGADGMGFVFHNDPLGTAAIGDRGGGLGMMGIQNGLGIEFDTYQSLDNTDDIANDHTSFLNTADGSASPSVSPVIDLGNIEDGQWHQVRVVSDGQSIFYTFDGVVMNTMTLAEAETYLGGSHFAYFGITGATGGLTELEQARITALEATAEDGTKLSIGGVGDGSGRNPIIGDAGDNTLIGTASNDLLSGLGGNDTLTGGLGNDIFVFGPAFGHDIITDFTRVAGNRDIIDLTAFHFESAADALSHAYAVDYDTVFDFGNGDVLTVKNTAAGYATNLLVDDLKV